MMGTPTDNASPLRPLDDAVQFPDIDFGNSPLPDMHERMAELRDRGRFVTVSRHGRKAVLATHYDDVEFAFGDEVDLPLAPGAEIFAAAQGRSLFSMTGSEHRLNRSLVAAAFTPAALGRYDEGFMLPEARERVAALGIGRGRAVDLVGEFTEDFGIAVILRILGIPTSEISTFRRWAHDLVSSEWAFEAAMQASREFEAYVLPIIHERRAHPEQDLISRMATSEVDGRRLTDIDIVSFLRVLFPAGADTTYRQLGNFLLHFLTLPGLRDRIAADRALLAPALDEMLRWEPALGNYPRLVSKDVVWRGAFLPAGTMLLLGVTSANRDPLAFSDPDSFRIERRAKRIVTFGAGIHFCIGAILARREMAAAITVLLDLHPDLCIAGPPPTVEGAVLRGPARLMVTCGASNTPT